MASTCSGGRPLLIGAKSIPVLCYFSIAVLCRCSGLFGASSTFRHDERRSGPAQENLNYANDQTAVSLVNHAYLAAKIRDWSVSSHSDQLSPRFNSHLGPPSVDCGSSLERANGEVALKGVICKRQKRFLIGVRQGPPTALRYRTERTLYRPSTIDLAFWDAPERLFDEPDQLVTWARATLAAARRVAVGENLRREVKNQRLNYELECTEVDSSVRL